MESEPKHHDNMTDIFRHTPKMEFLNCERLNYEEERIKSFVSWPVHFPVDPSRLAKVGFYYTGAEDEVVCFSCQGHVKDWTYGDIVLKKHADLYPNCDFIKNQSNNVPLIRTVSKSKGPSLILENADSLNSNSESNSVDFAKMKLEKERLKTFCANWPVSFINISDLAHAGFFYTGVGDVVQCPYCKGKISSWEPGNVPFQEHLKHFPWCDYLSQNITKVRKGPSWFQSASQDVCGNMKCPDFESSSGNKLVDDNNSLEDLGVHLHKGPVHPQQASLSARLRSFASWPSDAPVSKEDLAAAGFFYIGINDRTTCFYCNGGLCSWEKGDDPWVEHARWFSSCDFLRLNKGMDFVKSCTAKISSPAPKESISDQSYGTDSVEPLLKKVDEAMKSNLVKYVLETDLFPAYIVRAVVLLHIKKTGNPFSNIDDLCVAASYLKEEMEKESLPMKPVGAKDLNICENISNSCTISDASHVTEAVSSASPSSSNSHKSQKSVKNGYPEKYNSTGEDVSSKDHCLCKICMENEIGVVFLPCGHLHACTVCAPALKCCPMCRKAIQATVRVYIDL